MTLEFGSLYLGYATYLIATASPGPANLAIMVTSAQAGRQAGLKLAAGVISGSFIWGSCAALGLSTVMLNLPGLFQVIKIVGGLYLLWLAFKSLRQAVGTTNHKLSEPKVRNSSPYLQGLMIHLTNPKAVLGWSATIAVGVPADGGGEQLAVMFIGAVIMGVTIFTGYALLFSTKGAQTVYQKSTRKIHGLLSAVFGAAGLKLLADAG